MYASCVVHRQVGECCRNPVVSDGDRSLQGNRLISFNAGRIIFGAYIAKLQYLCERQDSLHHGAGNISVRHHDSLQSWSV